MRCSNCGEMISDRANFCPICGKKATPDAGEYLVKIACQGQRDDENNVMRVFLDDNKLYEVKPGESICFSAGAGFHNLKFRYKIRSKPIQIFLSSNYLIKVYYNPLTGLIETAVTSVSDMDDSEAEDEFKDTFINEPVVSSDEKNWAVSDIDKDRPEYEVLATSGFKEGVLSIFGERCEFKCKSTPKAEIIYYKNVRAIKRRMGTITLECEGKIHKVYSIPKDSYNEIMVYLTNHIEALKPNQSADL